MDSVRWGVRKLKYRIILHDMAVNLTQRSSMKLLVSTASHHQHL